jgi:hypothetical protein
MKIIEVGELALHQIPDLIHFDRYAIFLNVVIKAIGF